MKWTTVNISSRAAQQISGGSLWIFANEFVTKVRGLKVGEWVDFNCNGKFVGFGYVNPHSLITGRVCSLVPVDNLQNFLTGRIKQSADLRKSLGFKTSHRLVFSESDFLPGLIADFYTDGKKQNIVLQLTTAGMDTVKEELAKAFEANFQLDGLVLRGDSSVRNLEGLQNFREVRKGSEEALKSSQILENDTSFAADLVGGQKTGFFLDQRDNRSHLRSQADGKTVLDLCCYSGGWGISALMNNAPHVTFVDQSQDALDLVKRGLKMNNISEDRAAFICGDVFDYLEKEKTLYDIVVADPPAFVKSKKNLPQAKRAYEKLSTLSLRKLKAGGSLYSSSCSYHLSEGDFEEIVRLSLQKTGKTGRVFHRGTQSLDHPWVLNRPESKYLKCLGLST